MRAVTITFVAVVGAAVSARRAQSAGRSAAARRRLLAAEIGAASEHRRGSAGGRSRWPGEPPPRVAVALEAAGWHGIAPATVWSGWVIGGWCLVLVTSLSIGVLAGTIVLAVVVVGPVGLLWAWRDRGDALYEAAVPGLLDEVAAGLRSGGSLMMALRAAAARGQGLPSADLAQLVEAVDRGAALGPELDRWAAARPIPAVRLAAAALAVGAATGGRQARSIESVATTLRDHEAVRREATALATQSRASAAVMAVIPLVFAVASAVLDSRVAHLLLHTPAGAACVVGGLGLNGIAGLWMARITGGPR